MLDIDLHNQPLGTPRNLTEKEIFYQGPFGRRLFQLRKDVNKFGWNPSEVLNNILEAYLPSEWSSDLKIKDDFLKLKNIARGYKSIKEYLDALSVDKDRFACFYDKDYKDSKADMTDRCVTLSTIHSAKGLEWRNVFLIGMNDNNFPGIKNYDTWNPGRHERYLNKKKKELYVALTRASEHMHISYPEYVDGQEQFPSMLLNGIDKVNKLLN
jgi:superfamily I DNA/RNA helicase